MYNKGLKIYIKQHWLLTIVLSYQQIPVFTGLILA